MKKENRNLLITQYLFTIGIYPKKNVKKGTEFWYSSPLNPGGDTDPSFKVSQKHGEPCKWYDFSQGCGGNLVELIKLLKSAGTSEAYKMIDQCVGVDTNKYNNWMDNLHQQSIVEGFDHYKRSDHEFVSHKNILTNTGVIRYLKSRGVNTEIAQRYMALVLYKNNGELRKDGKPYYALGWATKGGWELSSISELKKFKTHIGKKDMTFIPCKNKEMKANEVAIFESMIDFISLFAFTSITKRVMDHCDIIILNSTNIYGAYADRLTKYYRKIMCFVDNDAAGNKIMDDLRSHASSRLIEVIDKRSMYKEYKDLNDMVKHKYSSIPEQEQRHQSNWKESIFKAFVRYQNSTSPHMINESATKTWYSLDTENERQQSGNLKYTETIDELCNLYTGFRIMFNRIQEQKKNGIIRSAYFYFNQKKSADNAILG